MHELNQAELNQMSANIKGHAKIVNPATEESKFYKQLLLKTNPDAEVFILGDNTVIVKVKIESAKVTDSENNTAVYKWCGFYIVMKALVYTFNEMLLATRNLCLGYMWCRYAVIRRHSTVQY